MRKKIVREVRSSHNFLHSETYLLRYFDWIPICSVLVALTDICKKLQTFSTGHPSIVSNRSHLQFWQIPFKPMTHICIWSHSSAWGSLYSSLYSGTVSHYLDKRKQTDKHNNITIALISCSATKASRAYSSAKRTGSCKLIWLKLSNITSTRGSLSSQQPRMIHGVCKLWQPNMNLEDLVWPRDCWSTILCACQGFSTQVCISHMYKSMARRYTYATVPEKSMVSLQCSYMHA